MSAGNGILWADDACCARLTVEKRYGAAPSVEVIVKEVNCV